MQTIYKAATKKQPQDIEVRELQNLHSTSFRMQFSSENWLLVILSIQSIYILQKSCNREFIFQCAACKCFGIMPRLFDHSRSHSIAYLYWISCLFLARMAQPFTWICSSFWHVHASCYRVFVVFHILWYCIKCRKCDAQIQ